MIKKSLLIVSILLVSTSQATVELTAKVQTEPLTCIGNVLYNIMTGGMYVYKDTAIPVYCEYRDSVLMVNMAEYKE
jgi:TctA family transporter